MKRITVRVEVSTEEGFVGGSPGNDFQPAGLVWTHVHEAGDNPRFYPAELAAALKGAMATAERTVQLMARAVPAS